MTTRCLFSILVLLLAPASSSLAQAPAPVDEIPGHPSELRYGDLSFEVPNGNDYRHTLSNGTVVYVVEDHQLPLVDLSVTVRVGSFLEPDDKHGLALLTGRMIRRGGTASLTAEEFDEKVEFLAAELETSTGTTEGEASLDCISPVLDESLALFFEMLRAPRFQQDRLDLEKQQLLEEMKQRNDRPQTISSRQWGWLMRGEDDFLAREITAAELEALSQDDLRQFHRDYWRPDNLIIGVSGDVDTEAILARLEQQFSAWTASGPEVPWPPPAPTHQPEPGVFYVQKDIPQGRVLIGHLGYQRAGWDDPDVQALAVMNDILGGGGFTSRLLKRIRSDEGLAYSAFSQYGVDVWWPGIFRMGYQSKSETVALAAKIALEELERIRREEVSDEELATAKASFIDVFPRQFESAGRTVRLFVSSEYEGRPHDYWLHYQDNVRAVTKQDVLRVAQEHLSPENLVFLMVGNWELIEAGDADGRATMKEFAGGAATELLLRDPLTLEPIAPGAGG